MLAASRPGRIFDKLLDGLGLAGGALFAALGALVTADILLRNLGLANLPWVVEAAEYTLYGATFAAAPWVLREGAHVRVDLVPALLPPRIARALELVVDALGAAIAAVLAWYGAEAAVDSFRLGSMVFKELVFPEWWILAAAPVPLSLMAVEFLRRMVRAFRGDG